MLTQLYNVSRRGHPCKFPPRSSCVMLRDTAIKTQVLHHRLYRPQLSCSGLKFMTVHLEKDWTCMGCLDGGVMILQPHDRTEHDFLCIKSNVRQFVWQLKPKLGHATEQWSQAQLQINKRMAEREKYQSVAITQSKSRPQSNGNSVWHTTGTKLQWFHGLRYHAFIFNILITWVQWWGAVN